MKATITETGAVVIPPAILQKLNLATSEMLEFDETSPFLKAVKVVDEALMRSVLGCCKNTMPGQSSDEWLNETRGPVLLPSHADSH